ncbi:MAG: uridine kinase [Nitrospira sp.]|nr:uridine kinase [Nitrospira sp.]
MHQPGIFSGTAPFVIGITGGTGAGKTTVSKALYQHVGEERAVLLHADHYYHDLSHLPASSRQKVNFDHPRAWDVPLLLTHLQALARGESIQPPGYEFRTHSRQESGRLLSSKPLVIVEGVGVFCHSDVRQQLSCLVFLDVADDVRFIRRLQRDLQERGRTVKSVVEQYLMTVKPMHQAFTEPMRIHADVIVSGELPTHLAVESIEQYVWAQMGVRQEEPVRWKSF